MKPIRNNLANPLEAELTVQDWFAINDITAFIYSSHPHPDLNEVVRKIKKLIPYSHSLSCLISDNQKIAEFFNYQSDDISQDQIDAYRTHYIQYDFILWYCASPREITFRQTDVIVENCMAESLFMQEWLAPMNAYYGATVNVASRGFSYCNICLYRSKEEGDFTDREIGILKVINHHLCIKFGEVFPNGIKRNTFSQNQNMFRAAYHLTDREIEILELVTEGIARRDISRELVISENTLKKHLTNIYGKMHLQNFEELIVAVQPGKKYIKQREMTTGGSPL